MGASATKTGDLTVPTGTAGGDYFVLFVADAAEAESDEANNTGSVTLAIEGDGGGGGDPDLSVTTGPDNPPVVIPSTGGSFGITTTFTNDGDATATFDRWTVVTRPSGRERVVAGPISEDLAAGASLTVERTQSVPSKLSAGTYTYTVNAGNYPDEVTVSASFTFEKEAEAGARTTAAADDLKTEGLETEEDWAYTERVTLTEPEAAEVVAIDAAQATATTELPEAFALDAGYPNPFRSAVTLRYALPEATAVTLTVYEMLGRTVAVLVDDHREAGTHMARFDGAQLASGVYLVRMTAGAFVATQQLVLAR